MAWLLPWLLLVHVLSAIAGFGPTYAFSLIGRMGGAEPQHANFATRVSNAIQFRYIYPAAAIQLVTGILIILIAPFDLTSRSFWWLDIAIVIFVITISFSYLVQHPKVEQLIEMTSAPPPPGASGPPPALAALVGQIQRGGIFMTVMLTIIIFLMVVKPQF
jgi:Predicted integral membrane protein (DUF2269)